MSKDRSMLHLLSEAVDFPQELLRGTPLVELTDHTRVLIENHGGVMEYERERICVRVRYGTLIILGNKLQICRMSSSQLVIVGQIQRLELDREVQVHAAHG